MQRGEAEDFVFVQYIHGMQNRAKGTEHAEEHGQRSKCKHTLFPMSPRHWMETEKLYTEVVPQFLPQRIDFVSVLVKRRLQNGVHYLCIEHVLGPSKYINQYSGCFLKETRFAYCVHNSL